MYKKFMKTASVIIVLFVIVYIGTLIDWVFYPITVFLQTLFVPILVSVLLFYISKPLVNLLSKKVSKVLSIIILYIFFIALIVLLIGLIIPEIQHQINTLIRNMPIIINEIQKLLTEIQYNEFIQQFNMSEMFRFEEVVENIGKTISSVFNFVSGTFSVISVIINMFITLFVVAFLLFYMLKEGEKFPKSIARFFQDDRKEEVLSIMKELDKTLSNYIQGIIIVCSSIGVLCYIAFSIIGLEYALILALVAMVTNVIPYLGPWIGAIPAVIVALIQSPMMAISVIIIIVVIQQIESILIQPQVMGKKMKMHPVTVLFLVLVAGQFIGIVGMILAVPTYALSKVIIIHAYKVIKLRMKRE